MLVTVVQDAPCSTGALFACVNDLARYPDWLSITHRVHAAPALDGDPGPAWVVDLRARIGLLARSKRLRMVRAQHVEGRLVVFERKEADSRHHSGWRMSSEVEPGAASAQLTMRLEYDGSFWGPVIERLLRDEIDKCRPRLVAQALRNEVSSDDGPTR